MTSTTEVQEARKSQNWLKHIINTPSMTVKISLDDDCKNGHNNFSMTGTIWENGKPHNDRNMITAGCCHEEILKRLPKLKIFADLHLCNAQGVPMYAEANGFYHLKESGKKSMQEYMRATDEQAEILAGAEDQNHFLYLIHSLGLPAQWKIEADRAIEVLQDYCNANFIDDRKKRTLKPINGQNESGC